MTLGMFAENLNLTLLVHVAHVTSTDSPVKELIATEALINLSEG